MSQITQQRERIVEALLERGQDSNKEVRDEIELSLVKHGLQHPTEVLKQFQAYLAQHAKKNTTHRVVILSAMRRIVHDADRNRLEAAVLKSVVDATITEMVTDKDINSDWQNAACEVFVETAPLVPDHAALKLIELIPASQLPHYFVMKSLADFAHSSPRTFVPVLKGVMAKALPVLALVKQENMRWVFATALGRFAEAVVQYNLGEGEEEPNPKYAVSEFSDSFFTSLSTLMEWSNVKDARIRVTVLQSIGHCACIISKENLETLYPKLLTLVLTNLQKEKPATQLGILQGLVVLAETAAERVPTVAAQSLENLWKALHGAFAMLYTMDDGAAPEINKCKNACMEAVEVAARYNPDTILSLIQKNFDPKLGSKDPNVRAATLMLLKHLISRLDAPFKPLLDAVVATVKQAISDTDYRIRKAIVQCVIALASNKVNGYMERDGGRELIAYVAKNAAIPAQVIAEWNAKPPKDAPVSPAEVRSMCTNMLSLFVSSLTHLDTVLWPFILESLGHRDIDMVEMFQCFPVICNCIHVLAERLGETEHFPVDYSVQVNLPKPAEAVAKFLVHVIPHDVQGATNTKHIVQAMLGYAPLLTSDPHRDQAVPHVWAEFVPQLLDYLSNPKFNLDKWDDVVHKLMTNTLTAKKDERWVEDVGNALMAQFKAYASPDRVEYKRAALSLLGLTLSKSSRKEYIVNGIEFIVENTDHTIQQQRAGCSKGLGFVSAASADAVVEKLNKIVRGPGKGEKSALFAKGKGTGTVTMLDGVKGTAMLSFGHVAQRAPSSYVRGYADAALMPGLVSLIQEIKGQELKDNGFTGFDMLAKGLRKHAAAEGGDGFQLKTKEQAVDCILSEMGLYTVDAKGKAVQSPPASYATATNGLHALSAILTLKPVVSAELMEKLQNALSTAFSKEWIPEGPSSPASKKDAQKDSSGVDLESAEEKAYLTELSSVFCMLLEDKCDLERFYMLIDVLENHVRSAQALVRQRSLVCLLALVQRYAELRPAASAPTLEKNIDRIGRYVGALVPRLSDTAVKTRQLALTTMHTFLTLHNEYRSDREKVYEKIKEFLSKFTTLKASLTTTDLKELFTLSKQTAQFLAAVIQTDELGHLIDVLLQKGLTDVVDDAANGACVVLNGLIQKLGKSLSEEQVSKYMKGMIDALPLVNHRENTMNGLLHCIKALANHHPTGSFTAMISYPTPHETHLVQALQVLAGDEKLCGALLEYILDVEINSQLFEESGKKGERVICAAPLSAACALGELIEVVPIFKGSASKAEQAQGQMVLRLISAIHNKQVCMYAVLLCAAHEVDAERPKDAKGLSTAEHIMKSLRSFIKNYHTLYVNTWFERHNIFPQLANPKEYPAGLVAYTRALCLETGLTEDDRDVVDPEEVEDMSEEPTESSDRVNQMFKFMVSYVGKSVDCYRVAGVTVVGQLLYHCVGNTDLVEKAMNCLLSRSGMDEKSHIKLLAVTELRNIVVHPYSEIKAFIASIATTLLTCFSDDSVIIAAMGTLQHIIHKTDCADQVQTIISPIITHLKPSWEKNQPEVRAEAFKIFAALVDFTTAGKLLDSLMGPNIFNFFPTVIVHTNDDEQTVRTAAKGTLHSIVKYLLKDSPKSKFGELFERPSWGVDKRLGFEEFSREFCKVWTKEYPQYMNDNLEAMNNFFKSKWDTIRANAAVFAGYLLSELDTEARKRVMLQQTVTGLIQLLSGEKKEFVRVKAACALGLINYTEAK